MIKITASESYLGYEYQALQALLLILPSGSNSKVYIERFDDVDFENGNEKKIIQGKFSLKNKRKITSKEPAFWKSLGNWIDLIETGIISEDEYHFLILTTRDTDDSIILQFTEDEKKRDSKELLDNLIEQAEKIENKNKENKKHIKKFLNLDYGKKFSLVEKIQIFTNQPNILEIQEKINTHLKEWSLSDFYEGFFDAIYGWWYREILKRLSGDVNQPLTHNELVETIQYNRSQQSAKTLPVYFDKITNPDKIVEELKKFNFVEQLHLIDLENGTVIACMMDYYLAAEHRSKWVRKLSHVSDRLDDYDKELKSKWGSEFLSSEREIKKLNIVDEDKLKGYGLKIFEWMDKYSFYPDLKLEKDVGKIWLWKGSFHMLSDECKVGWHPNFKKLVRCKT